MSALAPPFPYFGGKQTLGPRIAELLPAHRHYVEPYCGSLAVLLAKRPAPMETVNDLDGDLVHLWRMLRDQPEEMARVCALTPHSRAEHLHAYDRSDCGDIERARRVWVCLTQGRGATLQGTGWRHYVKPTGSTNFPSYLDSYVARMAAVADRLHSVSLDCKPALDVIVRFGSEPDVLLYVDPPYLGEARSTADDPRKRTKRYRVEMQAADEHCELAAALNECAAAVVLSGYPSPLYDELYADWHRCEWDTSTGQSAKGEWSKRTEVIWSNRPLNLDPGLFDLGGTS